jgi:hypothetical protein
MMKNKLLTLFVFFSALGIQAQDLAYYLPADVTYNPEIPTPRQVLGYDVGSWHASHDQLVYYMRTLAQVSDRIQLKEYARSYENRPLLVLIIAHPDHFQELEQIRKRHVRLTDPTQDLTISTTKLVHYMGYSVHGNEASGANAALITAYYLAAAQGPFIDKVLQETVILLDPSFNPDGLQRFSTWVNMHKSKNLVSDPNSREFEEVWPGGRTNHYWFDLNRDWMPVQHPESQGRVQLFHEWKPNVLTDHHEMGTNSTFFFQPGVPARKNPLTPDQNVIMTEKIASYHTRALDSIGSLYYSEEGYDDFYIGKGSTYPDLNGSVGILFEQASSRGHVQENPFGQLEFPFAIRNHFVTSLSTLHASIDMKEELLTMQRDFYKESMRQAQNDPIKGYVFGTDGDPVRAFELAKLIHQHAIKVYELGGNVGSFDPASSYIVPANQPQYRLIKSMFERRTSFTDSIFYDISTWTLPYAFNIPFMEIGKAYSTALIGQEVGAYDRPRAEVSGTSDYAYLFESSGYYTQRAIDRLLKRKIITEIAHMPYTIPGKQFARGSIIVPVGIQYGKKATIEATLKEIAAEDGIPVYALTSGFTEQGIDLGSRDIEVIEKPEVALLVGEGISAYEAGEVWHLLDQRYGMKVSLLPVESVGSVDLSRYNRLIFPHGSYSSLSISGAKLRDWIASGGVIIAWKNGGKWLSDQKVTQVTYKNIPKDTVGYKAYSKEELSKDAQNIGGAIFEARIDLSHPLSYGMNNPLMPLFRNHSYFIQKASNPYANPLVYTSKPLLSGYVPEEKIPFIADSPAVQVSAIGRGRIITFADNPNFRAFWFGTNKLFMNALFFGNTISSSTAD